MKIAVGIVAIAALLATPVFAADMPLKAPPRMAPVASWTGCYIGGNVGGAWQHTDWYDPQVPGAAGSDNGNGFVGGGQVGCDYQFANSWVIGIQDMFDATDVNSNHTYPGTPTETLSTTTHWIDTLTARLGYTITPQTLLYAKGGGAWARSDYTDVQPGTAIGGLNVTRDGWTVGGGLEYAFTPNWSAFVEYNYIGFGRNTETLHYSLGAFVGFPNYNYNISENISEALVGINYRFNAFGR
jgi:outer membrane immunogenic protein